MAVDSKTDLLSFRRLPAERDVQFADAAPAGNCCCCCCCCLHTIGGIAGAATASAKPPEDGVPSAIVGTNASPRYSAAREYWLSVIGLSVLACVLAASRSQASVTENLFMLTLVFPGIQFAGSMVASLALYCSKRPGQHERFAHLRHITFRATVWALAGAFVLLLLYSTL